MTAEGKPQPDSHPTQRLDKWLKIARLFKTRALATEACEERRIKVNGHVAKPAKDIKPGDRLTIRMTGGHYLDLEVIQLCMRSISAALAKELYVVHEREMSQQERELLQLYAQAVKQAKPKYKGRPTKKERRRIENLRKDANPWR